MSERPSVELTRPDDDGAGDFAVHMDGRKVGTLGSGDRLRLEVLPGEHYFSLRFFWISSPETELDLAEGDAERYEVRRAFGFGPFDVRYFTRRDRAILVEKVGSAG